MLDSTYINLRNILIAFFVFFSLDYAYSLGISGGLSYSNTSFNLDKDISASSYGIVLRVSPFVSVIPVLGSISLEGSYKYTTGDDVSANSYGLDIIYNIINLFILKPYVGVGVKHFDLDYDSYTFASQDKESYKYNFNENAVVLSTGLVITPQVIPISIRLGVGYNLFNVLGSSDFNIRGKKYNMNYFNYSFGLGISV